MPDITPDGARDRFVDVASLWRLDRATARDVIDAAVDCLLVDVSSPTLLELAGESPAISRSDLGPILDQVLDELGMHVPLARTAQAGAMVVLTRRFTRGEVSARELCRWAHGAIGHDGDPSCQAFVDLHDIYETVEYYRDEDDTSLERRTAEAARAFLDARH